MKTDPIPIRSKFFWADRSNPDPTQKNFELADPIQNIFELTLPIQNFQMCWSLNDTVGDKLNFIFENVLSQIFPYY